MTGYMRLDLLRTEAAAAAPDPHTGQADVLAGDGDILAGEDDHLASGE